MIYRDIILLERGKRTPIAAFLFPEYGLNFLCTKEIVQIEGAVKWHISTALPHHISI